MEKDSVIAFVQDAKKNIKAKFIGPPKVNLEFIVPDVKRSWKGLLVH